MVIGYKKILNIALTADKSVFRDKLKTYPTPSRIMRELRKRALEAKGASDGAK